MTNFVEELRWRGLLHDIMPDTEAYLLKNKTAEAHKKGIFGAPTFLINDKIFWGQDRLEFAISESLYLGPIYGFFKL